MISFWKMARPVFLLPLVLALSCRPPESEVPVAEDGGEEAAEEVKGEVAEEPAPAPIFRILPPRPLRPPVPREPVVPVLPEFRIYHENEPLPAGWVEQVLPSTLFKVVQTRLTGSGTESFPTDGHLYAVTPLSLIPLRLQLDLATWENTEARACVSPLFLAHSFEPDNENALPWRWTPLVMMFRGTAEGVAPAPPDPAAWSPEAGLLVPDREGWMRGLWMKSRWGNANRAPTESEQEQWEKVWESLASLRREPEEVWNVMNQQPGSAAWLPASVRLRHGGDLAWFSWRIPPQGTMLLLEHLVRPRDAEHGEEANRLLELLLSPQVQNEILEKTGYFPVNRPLGSETDGASPSLRTGEWLDRSEFLIGRVPQVQRALPVTVPEVSSDGADAESSSEDNPQDVVPALGGVEDEAAREP